MNFMIFMILQRNVFFFICFKCLAWNFRIPWFSWLWHGLIQFSLVSWFCSGILRISWFSWFWRGIIKFSWFSWFWCGIIRISWFSLFVHWIINFLWFSLFCNGTLGFYDSRYYGKEKLIFLMIFIIM